MDTRPPGVGAKAEGPDRASERIVIAILVVMAAVLGFLRFGFLPKAGAGTSMEFDLRNTALDARVGECVEVEDMSSAGAVTCVTVAEPGVVIRPGQGKDRIGIYDNLRRTPPYLVCSLRTPKVGTTCSGTDASAVNDWLLYDLNGFGMPARLSVEPFVIRPIWKRWAGRTHYTYEVQLLRHGQSQGSNAVWIAPDAPVTGVVHRQDSQGPNRPYSVLYREVPGCK